MESYAQIRLTHPGILDGLCPSRVVLDHITSRWGVLVLFALTDGTKRWGELRHGIDGISEKMLASTLRTLVADGIVHRESQPTVPPHVDYRLTQRGAELMEHMLPLLAWVADNAAEIVTDDSRR